MQYCLSLASRGAGNVAPNPMVGAGVVVEDRIIGEDGINNSVGRMLR